MVQRNQKAKLEMQSLSCVLTKPHQVSTSHNSICAHFEFEASQLLELTHKQTPCVFDRSNTLWCVSFLQYADGHTSLYKAHSDINYAERLPQDTAIITMLRKPTDLVRSRYLYQWLNAEPDPAPLATWVRLVLGHHLALPKAAY